MKCSLTIEGRTLAEIVSGLPSVLRDKTIKEMAGLLKAEGYAIHQPRKYETPGEFCARNKISHATLLRKVADQRRPDVEILRTRGERGNIQYLASNPAFDAFCRDGILTPARLAKRMRVSVDVIKTALADPEMPSVDSAIRDDTGRLVSFIATARWSTWLLLYLTKLRNPHLSIPKV